MSKIFCLHVATLLYTLPYRPSNATSTLQVPNKNKSRTSTVIATNISKQNLHGDSKQIFYRTSRQAGMQKLTLLRRAYKRKASVKISVKHNLAFCFDPELFISTSMSKLKLPFTFHFCLSIDIKGKSDCLN